MLVGVNEKEGVSTKEGLGSKTRLGTILNGVRLFGNCVEGKNMYRWMDLHFILQCLSLLDHHFF